MAAVDRRMGMIRRGTTPTAPKPINLPSQKLESQGLVPDVDIVPRGTFCWGRAGRSSAASGKNNEKTDTAPLQSEINGTVDNGTAVQNDLVSLDEVQGLAEQPNPTRPVETSISLSSSPACIMPNSASSSFGENDAKLDSGSPAASDAGSLCGSAGQTSPSESGTSPLATPFTYNNKTQDSAAKNVQGGEWKQSKAFPEVCCEGSENVSNLEAKQGTHGGNESLPGSQDFGYFEGFYSNHHAFFSPGMLYSNGPGMAFGSGTHPEPSQHDGFYSCLGVPYYDSTKDKEIVVITMVGNPGFHGNYFPHPALPDQYVRPTVCGNFLQFGHFDHFAVPGQNILHGRHHMSAAMNPMCSSQQDEFVCYEQGYYKDAWLNGRSVDDIQRGNGAYLPTSFSMHKFTPSLRDHDSPKRAGRQKSAYRNKRAAPKEVSSAVLKPERRVTLLTKVSQHEVIISNLQKSKPVVNGVAGGLCDAPSFSETLMEAPSCSPCCETAIAEFSDDETVHEIVDIEKGRISDVSRSLSAEEIIPQQATCTGSSNEDAALESSHDISFLKSKPETSDSKSSSTTLPTLAFHAHGETVECHEETVATSCSGIACQGPPAPMPKISEVVVEEARPNPEAKNVSSNQDGYIMNAAEVPPDASDSIESSAFTELANKHVNTEEVSCPTTVALLPLEHHQGSVLRLSNQKNNMQWRRKRVATVAKLEQEHVNLKAQEAVVDKKAPSPPLPSLKTNEAADSLPNATVGTEALPQCNISLSSCAPAVLSADEAPAAPRKKLDATNSLNCTAPDNASKIKKSKKVHKAISDNVNLDSVAESSPFQIRESSNELAMKTLPFAEGQSLNLKSVSCGCGKEWRPKLPVVGLGKSSTMASIHRASKAVVTINLSEFQESKPCLTDVHGFLKQRVEVSCDDECVFESKQQQQGEGCDTLSIVVDRQQTTKIMSSTCVIGFNSTEREQNVECSSSETLPSKYSRVDQRGNVEKLVGNQKLLEQKPLVASNPDESNHSCTGDMPMSDDSCKARSGCSKSFDTHLGVDHKLSKVAKSCNFSSTSESYEAAPLSQTKEESKETDDSLCSSKKNVSKPMLGTQCSEPKRFTREVNQSSKATVGLREQSSVKNNQGQKQLVVKMEPLRHVGPGHIMKKIQHAGLMGRSVPSSVRNCLKQGQYVASWEGRKIGFPLDVFSFESSDQNHCHPQETHPNFKGQSMHRWQQKKVWSSKVIPVQEQQPTAMTCSSVSKPKEGCTFLDGKPGAENRRQITFLQGTSRVAWKPKQISSVQVFNDKCKEGSKDPSSFPSQKKRNPRECLLTEYSDSAPLSSPCENKQQFNKQASQKAAPQMKETSDVCPVASNSSAPLSPSCGSGQQDDNMQGLMKPSSQFKKAFEKLPTAPSSSLCGSDIVEKESLKPTLQMKPGPEELPIVTSSSCATLVTPCDNHQQTADLGEQSYKAVLEMDHSAEIRKVTSSAEQVVSRPISQRVSVVATSLKVDDTLLTRNVKPHRQCTSWRPKTVSASSVVKSAFKEVNENDPSAYTQVERAPIKHTNPLPASIFAASNDLHVWKNNGRHPVRASYGLPYRRKDYPQLQKSLDHQAKFHTDGVSSLELLDRANTTSLDHESPRASKNLVMKEMKPTKIPPLEHSASKLKFLRHHVYVVKQAHFISNQHGLAGNRRPFSTKSNFSHDDNKKIFHCQQPLSRMCFFSKPKFSCDDNKRAVHHQQFPSHVAKHTEQVKAGEDSYPRGSGHVKSLSPHGSDIKPARYGQQNGWKSSDSDRRGWVVKTESRCDGQ